MSSLYRNKPEKKDQDRREGRRCCLGDGIDSIPWSTTVDIFYQDDLEEKDE